MDQFLALGISSQGSFILEVNLFPFLAHLSLGVNLLGHNGNSQDGRMKGQDSRQSHFYNLGALTDLKDWLGDEGLWILTCHSLGSAVTGR